MKRMSLGARASGGFTARFARSKSGFLDRMSKLKKSPLTLNASLDKNRFGKELHNKINKSMPIGISVGTNQQINK